ncbi:MAG TPA: long-chain fatty acid--CoA ligase [Symbiobacteriaceae bacterium]
MTMRYPLTIRGMLERAYQFYPRQEIVSRTLGGMHRYTYADYYRRVHQLAHALRSLGIGRGDRVGTFAWNTHRHLEAYFAVPSMGAVLHTVNVRLPEEHIVYTINHAEDRVLLVDADVLPTILAVRDRLKTVQTIVVMGGEPPAEPGLLDYETLLAAQPDHYPWPADLDEWEPAGLCYTSATTGVPKGVLYSHRAIWLHSMMLGLADTTALSQRDTVMPVVPMFHANAWGLPFAATWFGARQVLPGPRPSSQDIARLIQAERVTVTAGVPTVWLSLLQALEQEPCDISSLTRILVGGSAFPRAAAEAFQKRYGVQAVPVYGMTEAAPLVTVNALKPHLEQLSPEEQLDYRTKQGLMVPGAEIRLVDESGQEVPRDGQSIGQVLLRAPWIASEYYKDERTKETFRDGWYYTGDLGVIDPDGYLKLVDRAKDVIKSGGEWISSVDLENAIMAIPDVAEAAVVACPHPKWDERPLACVVPKPEAAGRLTREEILDALRRQFPSWWIPDDVVFLSALPKTGTGKFDKKVLRAWFQDRYRDAFPQSGAAD